MYTGEVPQGTSHRSIGAVAPDFAYLDAVVDTMIRQDPSGRPSSISAVKDELIMRGVQFATHQKLDQVRKTVVPSATPDDPLGGVDVTARGFSYVPGILRFQLEPAPPADWMNVLHTLLSYRSYPGLAEPAQVQQTATGATVPAKEEIVAEVARMVKEWVSSTNTEYRERVRKRTLEQERHRREALAERQLELEEQARAMERLRQANL